MAQSQPATGQCPLTPPPERGPEVELVGDRRRLGAVCRGGDLLRRRDGRRAGVFELEALAPVGEHRERNRAKALVLEQPRGRERHGAPLTLDLNPRRPGGRRTQVVDGQ